MSPIDPENAKAPGHPGSSEKVRAFDRVADDVASAGQPAKVLDGPSGTVVPGGKVADLRELMTLFPRSIKGMGRHIDAIMPAFARSLSPRHGAALRQLSDGPLTVGALAARLDVSLSTASGLLADLDREALIVRNADPADRRRTIVEIHPDRRAEVDDWLSEFASPLQRVLDELDDDERAAFLKAMRTFAGIVAPDATGPADCVG